MSLTYDIILYWLQFTVWFVQHKIYRGNICINKCIWYELTWTINTIESNLPPHNNNPCSDRWLPERSLELSLILFKSFSVIMWFFYSCSHRKYLHLFILKIKYSQHLFIWINYKIYSVYMKWLILEFNEHRYNFKGIFMQNYNL